MQTRVGERAPLVPRSGLHAPVLGLRAGQRGAERARIEFRTGDKVRVDLTLP